MSPPPLFKLLGFRASEPPNFLSHATPIMKLPVVYRTIKRLQMIFMPIRPPLCHYLLTIVADCHMTLCNPVLLITVFCLLSVLSFKGIHNSICNLRFFSMCTSLLHGWMSMTLHSPVRCSVTVTFMSEVKSEYRNLGYF